jgi:hypothetical protein
MNVEKYLDENCEKDDLVLVDPPASKKSTVISKNKDVLIPRVVETPTSSQP